MAQIGNECPICIETFTAATRKEITCPYCNYKTCIKCMKQHILNQQNPNCMNCHIEFNREFIDLNMTKNFRTKELKQHRENVLLEREKSLLPVTVVFAEQEQQARKNENECKEMEAQIIELQNTINNIKEGIITKRRHIDRLRRGEAGVASTSQAKHEKRSFIKPCVVTGCRGYLSTQYKCGICETWVCPHCHEVKQGQKDENHTCNPETVESIKLIAKETKPCPKCGVVISKIDGCSQMWCVECHTTFDWTTGRETLTKNIHNPHYYEWVRRNNNGVVPRNQNDVPHNPCGNNRLPNVGSITSKYPDDNTVNRIIRLLRCLTHIYDYEILRNRVNNGNDVEVANRDLRVKYLLNEITDDDWKKQLQQREKKREINIAKQQVCQMLVDVAGQYMTQLAGTRLHIKTVLTIEKDLEKIVDYYNESMQKVLDRFNSKSKGLTINNVTWHFMFNS